MEFICFGELAGLEKVGVVLAAVIGLLLFVMGVILAFRRGGVWHPSYPVKYDKISARLPPPLIFLLLGVGVWLTAGWWLRKTFPAQNLSFSQRSWTLAEVKERVENTSRLRLELQGGTASFALKKDREFSGACAADLLNAICEYYPSQLRCNYDAKGHSFVIAPRQ